MAIQPHVHETATGTGTGNLTLGGAPYADMQTFAAAFGAASFICVVEHEDRSLNEWELTWATVSSGALVRGTLLKSPTGAHISFSAGIKHVLSVYPGVLPRGSLVTGSGTGLATTTVGSDGQALIADSAQPGGVAWGPANPDSTDDVPEGTTNLYYTDVRVNARIDTRVDKAFVDALNVDADTLDGLHAADMQKERVTDPGGVGLGIPSGDWNAVEKSGFYQYSAGSNETPHKTHTWQYTFAIVHNNSPGYQFQLAADFDSAGRLSARARKSGTWQDWVKIWTGGNDGAGSGLDADKLDGVQGANYARLDVSNSGPLQFDSTTGPKINAYGTNYGVGVNSNELTLYTNGDVKIRDGAWDGTVIGTVLTTADEGAGNGLDADTVDGNHASAFATASHTHVAADVTDLGNAATRSYTVSTGSPSGGSNGDVHYQV